MQQIKKWGRVALGFVVIAIVFGLLGVLAPGLALAVAFVGPIKGRAVVVKRGAAAAEVTIASVRTKSLKINGELVDTTTDDSGVWRDVLEEAGQVSVEITVAGVVKDHTLLAESLAAGDRTQSTIFEYPLTGAQVTKDKVTALFFLASYSETGEYNGTPTFEATFQSVGAVTYTAGA